MDLGSYTTVTRVATQGRNGVDPYAQWVTEYRLQYSDDGVTFQLYKKPHGTSAKVAVGDNSKKPCFGSLDKYRLVG